MNWIILAVLIAVGVYDVVLALQKKETISQKAQTLFPMWIDLIIFAAGLVGLCIWKYYCEELDFALAVVMAGFWGHIWFVNEERFNRVKH